MKELTSIYYWGRKELTLLGKEGVSLYIRLHNRVNLYIGQERINLNDS